MFAHITIFVVFKHDFMRLWNINKAGWQYYVVEKSWPRKRSLSYLDSWMMDSLPMQILCYLPNKHYQLEADWMLFRIVAEDMEHEYHGNAYIR